MEPLFLGQVILWAGNFAPRGTAFCNGQLLPISSYTALFSLLGTTYGGDGRTTFGLPDLRGRAVLGTGQAPGLSNYKLGAKVGSETTTLQVANLPNSEIPYRAASEDAESDEPGGKVPAVTSGKLYSSDADEKMMPGSFNGAASAPFNNIQPSLGLNYIVALEGVFPSRS